MTNALHTFMYIYLFLCRLCDWFHICYKPMKVNKYEWMKDAVANSKETILYPLFPM